MALLSTKFWLVGIFSGTPRPPVPTTFLPDLKSSRNLKPEDLTGRELRPALASAIAPYIPAPTPPAALKPAPTSSRNLKPLITETRDLRPTITKVEEE